MTPRNNSFMNEWLLSHRGGPESSMVWQQPPSPGKAPAMTPPAEPPWIPHEQIRHPQGVLWAAESSLGTQGSCSGKPSSVNVYLHLRANASGIPHSSGSTNANVCQHQQEQQRWMCFQLSKARRTQTRWLGSALGPG